MSNKVAIVLFCIMIVLLIILTFTVNGQAEEIKKYNTLVEEKGCIELFKVMNDKYNFPFIPFDVNITNDTTS